MLACLQYIRTEKPSITIYICLKLKTFSNILETMNEIEKKTLARCKGLIAPSMGTIWVLTLLHKIV